MSPRPDAFLLLSFGGPERKEDVQPFLRRVTGRRDIPAERLAKVAANYYHHGGRSPINEANRNLLASIESRLDMPCYWGNRNWEPFLSDTLAQMAADGVRHAVVLATSAYPGWSSCGQYRTDLAIATMGLVERGVTPPMLTKLAPFCSADGFLDPLAEGVSAALRDLPAGSSVAFTAHSIPLSAVVTSRYRQAVEAAAAQVAERAGLSDACWEVVWQSRSGPPTVPWLEPSILDHLLALSSARVPGVAVCPIGFLSDHMEVVHDLDVEAAGLAAQLGIAFKRCPTPGADPRFADTVTAFVNDLVNSRSRPSDHDCPANCCVAPTLPIGSCGVPDGVSDGVPDGVSDGGLGRLVH